jgi:hypothetical protein
MNKYVGRIFLAYSLALLAACTYVPWLGRSWSPDLLPVRAYGFIWLPPQVPGYFFFFDACRLLMEIFSLTAVLAAGAFSVWGRETD